MSAIPPRRKLRELEFYKVRYINYDMGAMKAFGLNFKEWEILFSLDYWQEGREAKYMKLTRKKFGDLVDLSESRMKTILSSLKERGFLIEKYGEGFRTSSKWSDVTSLNGRKITTDIEDIIGTDTTEGYEEDVYGADVKSSQKLRPSLNQVKEKATRIADKKKLNNHYAVDIAEQFWVEQESMEWKNASNFYPLLRKYMMAWAKRDKKENIKWEERGVVNDPKNNYETRTLLKNLGVEELVKIGFNTPDGKVVLNHIGMLVMPDGKALNAFDASKIYKFIREDEGMKKMLVGSNE